MNIIRKLIISALLSLTAIGLTTSLPAFADGASDAALYCSGCHDGLTVNGVAVGGGQRVCQQRTVTEWTATIDRMNAKGCGVPAGSIAGIANYLAGLSVDTPPPICNNGPAQFINGSWVCPYPPLFCYTSTGSQLMVVGIYSPDPWVCPAGTSTTPPPTCTDGLPTFDGSAWICPTSTTSTSSTSTTVTTTTTTLCNSYVNGTTQYLYSGSGTCHSFAIDDMSGAHIVRDQAYCKKHMSHFNSKGNHVHAYPHPICM